MANEKISDMPVATALTGTELVEVVQGGINKQTTTSGFGIGSVPVKATAAELIANTNDAKFATALALRGKLAANDTETGNFSVAQTDDQVTIFVDSATAVVATFPVLTASTYVTLVNIGAGDVSWVASGTNFEGAVASLPGGVVGAAVFFYKTTTDIKVVSPPTVESVSVLTNDTTTTGNITTGEDTLQTYAVPANQLANNGSCLTGAASGTFAATANNKRIRLKFGATTILDTGALVTSAAGSWVLRYEIVRTGAATQKCNAFIVFSDGAIESLSAYVTAAETLSGSVNIVITGEATATNDIVKETFKAVFEP